MLANTTVIPWGGRTGTGAGGDVLDFAVKYNGPTGQADLVVDIVGYFVENRATELECVTTASNITSLAVNTRGIAFSPSCPGGYAVVGGECTTNEGYLSASCKNVDNRWACIAWAGPVQGDAVSARARCCRVPGQ